MKKKVYTMPNVKAVDLQTPAILAISTQAKGVDVEQYLEQNTAGSTATRWKWMAE